MTKEWSKQYIEANKQYAAVMPHSEVCMHMGIAGKQMFIEWDGKRSVQIFERKSFGISPATNHEIVKLVPFSAPVLTGEAGLYQDEQGYYLSEKEL